MKFLLWTQVRQASDNEDADGWNKWRRGIADETSITVTDPGGKLIKLRCKHTRKGRKCTYYLDQKTFSYKADNRVHVLIGN